MKTFNFYAGLFVMTAATLMLQLIQTRILSVVAWYHLAFFVISMAMFGLTVGAVWVYLRGARFSQATLSADLAKYSAAFAVATGFSVVTQMTLAPVPTLTVTTVWVWLELAVCLAVPFFLAGVVVSLALTRSPFPVGRVYGVDLAGAAVGCFGVIFLLNVTDGPSAVLWTATLGMISAMLFAHSGIGAPAVARTFAERMLQRRGVWIVALAAVAVLNGMDEGRAGIHPIFAKSRVEVLEPAPWYERWNSFSRIAVSRPLEDVPGMWGASPNFRGEDWRLPQSFMHIDGDAATYAYGIGGDVSRAGFLRYDITTLAYNMPDRHKAAIIGVGGGRDLISAKVFGVPDVTGVEINPTFVDLLFGDSGISRFVGLRDMAGVKVHVDEARSWMARSTDHFDVLQMSLIDTWAATGAGAFTLSENGLYTVEAWRIFLDRLTPRGVFTVSRWYSPHDVGESGRLVSLAMGALIREGVADPREHIYVAAVDHIVTLIVSRTPFTTEELTALDDASARYAFKVLARPGSEPESPVLRGILATHDMAGLVHNTGNYILDLTPPTDDRPFFFNQLPLTDAAAVAAMVIAGRTVGVGSGNILATSTLVVLFVVALLLVVAAIYIPLKPTVRDMGRRLVVGGTAYFMLLGLGFMFVEIALLQRFSVFLGHPIYSLSIALFSLILFTGVGSMISDYVRIETRGFFGIWAGVTAAYLASLNLWVPGMMLGFDSASLVVRGLLCIAIVLPAGLLMGFGFPTGMRLVGAVDQRPTPWFWGINGASGVLASAMAVGCSLAYGIGVTLDVGAICYVLLVPAGYAIRMAGTAR